MFLWGETVFFRREVGYQPEAYCAVMPWDIGRRFSVKCFHSHWFQTNKKWLVFVNISTFLEGRKVRSAAEDFNLTKKDYHVNT